jgi:hypothetical protein
VKRKTGTGLNNFWKIQCLDCGINCDLLTDNWKRIICRECLDKHEFKEVEHEGFSDSDSEMGEVRRDEKCEEALLRDSDSSISDNNHPGLSKTFNHAEGVE